MRTIIYSSSGKRSVEMALRRPTRDLSKEFEIVRPIITNVRKEGDIAMRRYTEKFDGCSPEKFRVPEKIIQSAFNRMTVALRTSMEKAITNIRAFQGQALPEPIAVETTAGVTCAYVTRPMDCVGLYIPGGTAPLFSTLLMLAVPAQLAGVRRIVICTPPQKKKKNAGVIFAAARILGLDEIYSVGGAQAIAALAYGTETIPKVDLIAGPGNAYVAAAKALVNIDPNGAAIEMLAGPSELLIIADASANPAFVAADLLSQAEHGMGAQVVLLTTSRELARSVTTELQEQLSSLLRREIAAASLASGCIIVTKNIGQAIMLCNTYAPEHLSIQTEKPDELLGEIQNAGSVFLGKYAPETVGDYCSGTNHVLPTSGTARTQSGVSVRTFQKRISVQKLTQGGLDNLRSTATCLARAEGLEAHARAVDIRFSSPSSP